MLMTNLVTDHLYYTLRENEKLNTSNMKAIADDKLNVTLYLNCENILGKKGENAGYQHFLLFPKMFSNNVF